MASNQFETFYSKSKSPAPISSAEQPNGTDEGSWKAPESWVVAPDAIVGNNSLKTDNRNKSRSSQSYATLPLKNSEPAFASIVEDEMNSSKHGLEIMESSSSNLPRILNTKIRSSTASLSRGNEKLAS